MRKYLDDDFLVGIPVPAALLPEIRRLAMVIAPVVVRSTFAVAIRTSYRQRMEENAGARTHKRQKDAP
jgi:hypothetical protein